MQRLGRGALVAFLITWGMSWACASEFSTPSAKIPALPACAISPVYVRVELAAGATSPLLVQIQMSAPAILLGMDADCGCVRPEMPAMTALPAGRTTVRLQVLGILPGVKTLTVRTSIGTATATIQVVTPGFGDGMAIAALAVRDAAARHQRLIALVHDLRGETRNCGCSSGSLGGIDHLAALAQILPGARLVLTGDVEGTIPGSSIPLIPYGWEVGPADIVATTEPLVALGTPGVAAVVDLGVTPVANQRVIRPLLDRGALAHLLFVDERGTVVEQRLLPIDRTLPAVARLAVHATAEVRPTGPQAAVTIDHTSTPSNQCTTCHAVAHDTWDISAHARALSSLTVVDQTSACASCHTTPLVGRNARAPNVGCTACHQGTEHHVQKPATATEGIVDCRTCHDAHHHPTFDPVAAWLRIRHGK